MSHILERPLHACVAPGGIVVRNAHHQPADFGEDPVSARARVRVGPLPHDELSMPPYYRVRCDNSRDLTQDLPAQPMPADRQPASIVIGELEPTATQMASKDPIFFDQKRHGLALLAIQPASHDGEYYLESGRVDHGRSLYHEPHRAPSVDPAMGHYGHSHRLAPM